MGRLKIQELLSKDFLFVNPREFCYIHPSFILSILLPADEWCRNTGNTRIFGTNRFNVTLEAN